MKKRVVGRDRQIMTTVGRGHTEAPLAARTNTVLLHQPLHALLTHPHPALTQLPP